MIYLILLLLVVECVGMGIAYGKLFTDLTLNWNIFYALLLIFSVSSLSVTILLLMTYLSKL